MMLPRGHSGVLGRDGASPRRGRAPVTPAFGRPERSGADRNPRGRRIAVRGSAAAVRRREGVRADRAGPAGDGARRGGGSRRGKPVPARNLAVFTRQLSVMIDAGMPLVECLDTLGRHEAHRPFREAVLQTRVAVEGGSSLAEAMRAHPRIFDPLYTNMIAAGEAGGILDTILKRLAAHIEKAAKLKAQVRSALTYPIAVVSIASVVVGVILWKVIPAFDDLFAGLGAALPLPTRVVIASSDALVSYFPLVVAAAVAAAFGFSRFRATARGGRFVDAALLRLPALGPVLRKVAVARFCRTLATLLGSGVPLLAGLEITAKTAGNAVIEDAVLVSRAAIERGETVSAPLRRAGVFPPMVTQMINVGETSGTLDAMLAKVADFYEEEVDAAVAGMLTLLEPVMIALLGVVIGGIVIAMYLPIFDLIGRMAG